MEHPLEGFNVARTPTRPEEEEELEEGKDPNERVSVKIKRSVLRRVRTVAAHKGIGMGEYLEQIIHDAILPEIDKLVEDLGGGKRGRK